MKLHLLGAVGAAATHDVDMNEWNRYHYAMKIAVSGALEGIRDSGFSSPIFDDRKNLGSSKVTFEMHIFCSKQEFQLSPKTIEHAPDTTH